MTSTDFPWLTVLGLVPLVGALLVAALPRGRDLLAKQLALVASLVVLVGTIVMCAAFEPGGDRFQFVQAHDWIPAFGVQYAVGADGIALVLIALIAVLVPVVVLASWHDADPLAETVGVASGAARRTMDAEGARPAAATSAASSRPPRDRGRHRRAGRPDDRGPSAPAADTPALDELPRKRSVKTFFALLLVLETMMIGVFAATDVFLFYVFFEAMLIPMYFLIGQLRRPAPVVRRGEVPALQPGRRAAHARRRHRPLRRLGQPGRGHLRLRAARPSSTSATPVQIALFSGFFIAFAIKAPLFPFHTWLPDAGAEAPVGGAVLLVGILDKVGTFGFLRYCLPLFPDASRILAPVRHRPVRHRHPLRRAAGHGPEGPEAAGVLHVGRALRVHRRSASSPSRRRARPAPCSTWSTTACRPARCSSSSASSSPAAAAG